jgi:hypothetical protein
MTVDAVMGQGALVVNEFASLIMLVVAVGLGFFGVKYVISQVRRARH